MKRKIIHIDEKKCNGCGACAQACHENAIAMIDGKARLIRDDYCDGLGDCLPACPADAITFVEREAAPYDAAAVKENQKKLAQKGCPGSRSKSIVQDTVSVKSASSSQLRQWPVQIRLAPVHAPYYQNANLLIAADCTAYAYGNFHMDFIRNHITLIGCPKLDSEDAAEKLTQIISENDIKSLTIVRMEVPCCGGIENAAKTALQNSKKFIPWQVVTIGTDGRIVE